MTTPQSLTEERIDGEFHYATLEINGWAIHRKDGTRNVGWARGRFRSDGQDLIDLYDRQARHFIERERERVSELLAGCNVGIWVPQADPNKDKVQIKLVKLSQLEGLAASYFGFDRPAALSPDVLGDQKDKGKAALTAPEREEPVEVSEPSAADVVLEGEFLVKRFDGGDKPDESDTVYRVGGELLMNAIADAAGTHDFTDDLHEGGWECRYRKHVRVTIERIEA